MPKKSSINEIQNRIREKEYDMSSESYYFFVRKAWQYVETVPFVDSWSIGCLTAHIEAHLKGDASLRKLIINLPPGHSKTRICTIFATCWDWIHFPNREVMLATNSHRLVEEIGDNIRNLIESEWYYSYWCEQKNIFKPSKTNWTKQHFRTDKGGKFIGVSPTSNITGSGTAGRLVIDDLNDLRNYLNKEQLAKDNDWYDSTLYNRVRVSNAHKLIVQQRVAQNDITAHILSKEHGYFHLVLPAQKPVHILFESPLGKEYNDNRKPGEWLAPERFNEDYFYSIKQDMFKWQAAYLQEPKNAEGGLIKSKWLKYYTTLPNQFDQIVISADLATKDKVEADYTVFLVLGKVDSNIYLIDCIRDKMEFDKQFETFLLLSNKYPEARAKLIEDKQTGTALISVLKKYLTGIIPVNPGNKLNKEQRAYSLVPEFIAGNLYFPDITKCEWMKDFNEELLTFPTSKHDDQIDAYVQAISYLSIFNTHNYNFYLPQERKTINTNAVDEFKLETGIYNMNNSKLSKDIFK